MNLNFLLKLALKASFAAGDELRRFYSKGFKVREKPGAGLLTEADLAAEQAVLRVLAPTCSAFSILSEEAGLSTNWEGKAGQWILDPLDGTTNFVHHFPMFSVSLAATWLGQIVVGVVHHPILKETTYAVRGKGAYLLTEKSLRRIHVSRNSKLKNALLTTGFTYKKGFPLKKQMGLFSTLSQKTRAIRRPGSAALDLSYTGCGVFDGFWERDLKPWDMAAGALIVREAGGVVTRYDGSAFDLTKGEILACSKAIYPQLVRVTKKF